MARAAFPGNAWVPTLKASRDALSALLQRRLVESTLNRGGEGWREIDRQGTHSVIAVSASSPQSGHRNVADLLGACFQIARGELGDFDQKNLMRDAEFASQLVLAPDGVELCRRIAQPRDEAVVLPTVVLERDPQRLRVPVQFEWSAIRGAAKPFRMCFGKRHAEQLLQRGPTLTLGEPALVALWTPVPGSDRCERSVPRMPIPALPTDLLDYPIYSACQTAPASFEREGLGKREALFPERVKTPGTPCVPVDDISRQHHSRMSSHEADEAMRDVLATIRTLVESQSNCRGSSADALNRNGLPAVHESCRVEVGRIPRSC